MNILTIIACPLGIHKKEFNHTKIAGNEWVQTDNVSVDCKRCKEHLEDFGMTYTLKPIEFHS